MPSPDLSAPQRCPHCNDEWLNGYPTCRRCRLPLLVPARELAITHPEVASDLEPEVDTWPDAARYIAEELLHEWRGRFTTVRRLFTPSQSAHTDPAHS